MAELCVRTEPLIRCRTALEPSIRAGRSRESSGSPEPLEQLCLSLFRSLSWEECEDVRPPDPLTSTPFIAVLAHSIVTDAAQPFEIEPSTKRPEGGSACGCSECLLNKVA